MESRPTAPQRLVVVLGMHRSGTSAITRGLGALGVELGDRLMPPVPGNNEKGFWEDLDINALSNAVLQHLGQAWDALAPLDWQAVDPAGLERFVAEGVELLRHKIGDAPVFGLKNPRITRMLPFWQRVFEHLGLEVGYVIALRHPLSVSDSLAARDGFETEKSLLLWLDHMVAALRDSAGRPRVVVDYDRLMDQPGAQLRRLAAALQLPFDAASPGVAAYLDGFLEAGLRHSRHGADELHTDRDGLAEVAEAYALLARLAADELPPDAPTVAAAFDRYSTSLARLAPLLGYMTRRDIDVEHLRHATAIRDGLLAERERHLAERDAQLAALGAAVAERDGRIVSLGAAVAERDGRIVSLGEAVAERDGRIVSLGEAVAERDGRIASLGEAVAERDGRIASLGKTVAEQEARIAGQEASIAQLVRTLDEIYRSTGWRLLAPLRWYGRQRQRLRTIVRLLPEARARSGGLRPLLRRTLDVLRRDGIEGLRALIRRHGGAPAAPATEPAVPDAAQEPPPPPRHAAPGKPEILFVSHEASRTGAPIFLLDVARLLRDRLGLSCAFLLCAGGELTEQFRALGETWILSQRHELDPLTLHALKQRDIRLIYSNTVTNGQVQRRLRELDCPLLCHVHELGFSIERHFGAENFKAVLATTDFFLAGSGAVAQYLVGTRGIPAAKVAVAHPFIDVAANQHGVTAAAPLTLPADALVVGACGTLGWRKGTDLFVQVARRVLAQTSRPVHFVWLGGPLAHGEFRNIHHDAEVLGIAQHISFPGAVESHLAYFGQFDIFLLPSREDPFPLVVLDAASLGLPVVCFAQAGGAPELVETDAGMVVPYLDIERMAEAVVRLVDDADLRGRLGETARQKVRARHDIEVGGRRIADLVQGLLKSSVKETP